MKSSYTDSLVHITYECKYHLVDTYNNIEILDIIGLQQICHSNKKDIKNNNKRNTSYDKIGLNKKQYHKIGIPYEQYNTRIKV